MRRIAADADLWLAWLAMVVVAPLLPPGHVLVREDLVPWMAVALAWAAWTRGRGLGPGPHPALRPRESTFSRWLHGVGRALVPAACWAAWEVGRAPTWGTIGVVVGLAGAVGLLRWLAGEWGRTAWAPPHTGALRGWLLTGVTAAWLVAAGAAQTVAGGTVIEPLAADLTRAAWVGGTFYAVALWAGRTVHPAQRARAGRADGRPWRPSHFRVAYSLVGPLLGGWALFALFRLLVGELDVTWAWVAALFTLAWARILWPHQAPLAVACVLHELVPVGGADQTQPDSATGFDRPPEGSLRLKPLDVRRSRAVHPWIVPVRQGRLASYDDPVAPLWTSRPPPRAAHVLGEAAFELDPAGREQTERIVVRIRGADDTARLGGRDIQTRRVVALRAFPAPGASRQRAQATWVWEARVPAACRQVVDASTPTLTLYDGSILVLSSEGVARSYEVEIGAPVHDPHWLAERFPQLEDYAVPA